MVEESKQSSSGLEFKLHPLVLINVSDHDTRMRANSSNGVAPPVLGCLLGSQSGREVDVSNSFELKYSTGPDGSVTIDNEYLAKKQDMYKQVFAKLDVVGWYATGARVEDVHMQIHRKMTEINESPVFLLLNPAIDAARKDLPVTVFETELHVTEGVPTVAFVRANYTVETSDAERIGVDQVAKIMPSGKATGSEQLSAHLAALHSAIKMLHSKIAVLQQLMDKVSRNEVPYPHALLRQLNSLVHGLPALDSATFKADWMTEQVDTLGTIYLAALTKATHGVNEITDKLSLVFERTGRRRGGMGGML